MGITEKDVEYVSALARIAVGDAEKKELASRLAAILEFVSKISTLDTAGVPPTTHAVPRVNGEREDVVRPSLPVEELLKGAPERDGDFIAVPRVIE